MAITEQQQAMLDNMCYVATEAKLGTVLKEIADEASTGGVASVEVERLNYYGDKDIISSDESYFTVNETGEIITGLTDIGKSQTELVIPYKINGVKITSIDNYVFSSNVNIQNVIIPNSVTSIGHDVFFGCSSLTSINIPDSVTSFMVNSFYGCSSLTSINIPNSVVNIGLNAFKYCTSLTKIKIPSSVTSISSLAFYGDTNLTIYCEQGSYADTYAKTNNIPYVYTDVKDIATETEIERLKYYGDKDIIPSLESYFTVNSTGETITGLTEAGKTQTELVIPYKINGKLITTLFSGVSVKDGPPLSIFGSGIANGDNTTITKIVLPNSIINIGDGTFACCTSLASINIPDSVTSIGDYAFYGCNSLTSINISNGVTTINSFAFPSHENFVIYCNQGSAADTYAKNNSISVVYTAVKESNLLNKNDLLNKVDKIDHDNGIAIGPDDGHVYGRVMGLHIESNMIYENTEDRFKLSKDGLEINYNASSYAPNTADVIVNRNVEAAEGTYSVVTHKLSEKANTSDVLLKTNTTEFTPTANYHPATKKYVDDSISTSGGGDMLKTVYDTNNTGVVDNAEKLGGQLPSYYAKASTSVVVTLPNTVADWTTNTDENGEPYYTKSFSNEIFTSDGTPFVGVNYSDTISIARQQAEAYDSIDRVKVTDGSAIFYCFNDIPSVSLDIQIKMVY